MLIFSQRWSGGRAPSQLQGSYDGLLDGADLIGISNLSPRVRRPDFISILHVFRCLPQVLDRYGRSHNPEPLFCFCTTRSILMDISVHYLTGIPIKHCWYMSRTMWLSLAEISMC